MIKRAIIVLLAAVIAPWQVARMSPAAAAGPSLTLSPTTVLPGGRLTVNGSGFNTGTIITVSVNTAPTALSQTLRTTSSDFSIYFDLPSNTQPGSYTVTATATTTSSTLASAPFQVPVAAITLNPNPAIPNTSVTVTGTGFTAGAAVTVQVTVPTVTAGNRTLQATVNVDSSGAFATSLSLPADTKPGSYVVYASIGGTNVAQAGLTVSTGPAITLSPASILSGAATTITVSGTGFGSGEQVHVQYTAKDASGNAVVQQGTASTTPSGSFVLNTLPVPANVAAGAYTVTANGLSSGKSASTTLTVLAGPTLTLSPPTALPGATVTVTGQHFAPNASVTVSASMPQLDSTVVTQTATATADGQGNFTATLQVPVGSVLGNVAVQATQTQNGSTLFARATLTIATLTPSIAIMPSQVLAGSAIAISGKGFAPGPGYPVTVSGQVNADGTLQTISQTVDPDAAGSFTTVMTVPGNAAPGTITLYAKQQTSNVQATATFTIEQPTATPTSTPTATATPSPTATNTPLPTPTSTTTSHKSRTLKFKSISLWYHTVRVGTYDHLEVQASKKTKVGIWVNILFPNGKHLDFYERTNNKGHWSKQFDIPRNAVGKNADSAHIELQLLQGKTDVKTFMTFTIIR